MAATCIRNLLYARWEALSWNGWSRSLSPTTWKLLMIQTQSNTLTPNEHDRELEARLISTFARRQLPIRLLQIEARDGIVTLRGKVHSYYQRQQCIHCGLNLAGVFRLIDALEVSYDPCPIPIP